MRGSHDRAGEKAGFNSWPLPGAGESEGHEGLAEGRVDAAADAAMGEPTAKYVAIEADNFLLKFQKPK